MKRWKLAGISFALIALLLFMAKDLLLRRGFDAKYFSTSSATEKFGMALDLVQTGSLLGLPVDTAVANLGTPDHSESTFIAYRINDPLGYRDTLTLTIDNGLVKHIYLHD